MCRKELKRAMLGLVVEIEADGILDFDEARRIAQSEARKRGTDPMLMAWFDKDSGKYSPLVEWSATEKPGWLVYAQTRGGTLVIDINREQYVFIYRPE